MSEPERPLFPAVPIVRRADAPAPPAPRAAEPRRLVHDGAGADSPPPRAVPPADVVHRQTTPEVRQVSMVAGVVDGSVTVEHVAADRTGLRVAAFVVVVALLAALGSGRTSLVVPVVLPLLLVAAGGVAAWRAGRSPGRDAPSGVPVRRFRVRSVTGEVVGCALHGDLSGGEIRNGDIVQVYGRQARRGEYTARRVNVLSTAVGPVVNRVSGRLRAGMLVTRWSGWLSYALAGLVVCWTLVAFFVTGS